VFPYNPRAMDEHMKARLIGATVLVVLAVLLVPELLSGPKSGTGGSNDADGKRGMRSYTIDLGGAVNDAARLEPTAAETSTNRVATNTPLPTVSPPGEQARPAAATDENTESASAVANTTPKSTPPAAPATTTLKPATSSPTKVATATTPVPVTAAAKPVPPTSSATPATKGAWAVQVGAFSSSSSARKLVADLGHDGFNAYVAPLNKSGKTLYRVRVGPASSRPDAEKLAARLKSRGTSGSVVPAG
jgi:DedD protein